MVAVDDVGRVIPEGPPPPAGPGHTDPPGTTCPQCARARALAAAPQTVTRSQQTLAQVGPVILGWARQDDGTGHFIIGAGTPGLGVGAYQCYTTGEGGIDGWALGATGGAPVMAGVGPAASYATDGTNTTSCVGVGAGDVNGVSYAVTVPVRSPFGASGNPGDTYVPASMNPDGTIAPARFIPAPARFIPAPAAATPAPVTPAPSAPVPANANFRYGNPGDTYVPAALNPDGTITPGYSIPRGR